ncbi:MAG: hypothetical protein ACRDZO_08040 [Egibacteraceae bacterium]
MYRWHIHVHTHAWRFQDSARIRDVQEATGWLPDCAERQVTPFEGIPELSERYERESVDSYFPLYSVNA